jgi:hypothetical protein
VKIDAHSYKDFRESIRGDRLIKLSNYNAKGCGMWFNCAINLIMVGQQLLLGAYSH